MKTLKPLSAAQLYRPASHAVTPRDRELFERELSAFVPPDAFDAHAHLYTLSASGLIAPGEPGPSGNDDAVGLAVYRERTAAWMGDRCPASGLFFGLPSSPNVDTVATNAFVASEVQRSPGSL